MARKRTRPQSVKGFRPGKEPPGLKKRLAKAQIGKDASWAQRATVEAVAGRSPQQVRAMVRKWTLTLGVSAVALGLAGIFLYRWVVLAGVAVHVVALVLLFLAYRLRKQGAGLVEMAESFR